MSLGVRIEQLKEEHIDEVIELLQQLSLYRPERIDVREIWKVISAQSYVFSVVALQEKYIVGYGSLIITHNVRGGILGRIEDIVVDSSQRRKGIGSLILQNLCQIAEKKGCYKVSLDSKSSNIAFYKNSGFTLQQVSLARHLCIRNSQL